MSRTSAFSHSIQSMWIAKQASQMGTAHDRVYRTRSLFYSHRNRKESNYD